MKKIAFAAGGVLALALIAATPAAAVSLGTGGSMLLGPAQQLAAPDNVYWVRRCWRQRVWWGGRWHWTTRCRNVWVNRRW